MAETRTIGVILILMVSFGLVVPGSVGASVVPVNEGSVANDPGTEAPSVTNRPAALILVEPGESIQNAVDQAAPGDTIEVASGTYEQSVTIDKNISLTAPKGAILDGDAVDAEDGIVVEAEGASISGFEIRQYSDDGIDVRADDVVVSDATVRLNGGRGIEAVDQTITQLTIRGSKIKNNDFTGVYAEAEGATLILENAVINENGDYGVFVDDFKTIQINDSRAIDNADSGVRAPTDSVLGRTTEIDNFTARLNGHIGLSISGTADSDTLSLTHSRLSDNDDIGVYAEAETATVIDLDANDNGDAGLVVASADPAEVSVSDSTLNSNGGSSFDFETGLYVEDGDSVTVTNVTANSNAQDGIFLGTDTAVDTSVEFTNVTARLNGDEGFHVLGTSGADTLRATDSDVSDNDDIGIYTTIETVDVSASNATDNGDAGVVVDSTSPSDVSIFDASLSSNGGTSFNYEDGLFVEASNHVNLTEVTVNGNEEDGVILQAEDTLGMTVAFRNSTARLNGDEGLDIGGTADPDELTITDATVSDNGDNGIVAATSTVTVDRVTVDSNGDGGVVIQDGVATATILNSTLSDNGADDFHYETGLYTADASTVTVRNTETNANEANGIQIDAVDVASRTVTIENVTSRLNTFDGIQINPSANADAIEITETVVENNGDDGIDTAGSPVTIRTTDIENNSDIGLVFSTDTRSGSSVHESVFVGNEEHAISNTEGAVVNATRNWWGNPAGPGADDCVGNVDCTGPLTIPPGTEGPPPVVGDQNPTDPDGDGSFEDIDGNGEFSIVDVQTLFTNRGNDVIENNPAFFDYNGDGEFSIADVQQLFVEFVSG